MTVPPIRADHVGSLLRPAAVPAARAARAASLVVDDAERIWSWTTESEEVGGD